MMSCIAVREYSGGIVAIDSGQMWPEMAACYLLESADRVAVIETGNRASADRILDVLDRRGWSRESVSHVIVTHVHLDHAGGAGVLLKSLPGAELVVHPRGARHMVDPSRLEASARAVYGDQEFDKMYGTLVPVPESRTRIMQDGDSLSVAGRELKFVDSPGHARHHFCVWDEATRGWFTGDTFGLSYRVHDSARGPFIFPTTTPIQFDPPVLVQSIRKLLSKNPDFMYLTHFGRVGDVKRLSADLIAAVDFLVELAESHVASPDRTRDIETGMMTWLMQRCREHGVSLSDAQLEQSWEPDVKLNTQGIEFWLDHRG